MEVKKTIYINSNEEENNTQQILESDKVKSSIDFIINNNSIEQHISQISKLILEGKNNDALIIIEAVLNKDNLNKDNLSKLYISKGNSELGLGLIDECIISYTKSREYGSYYSSIMLSKLYIQYNGEKFTKEEAFELSQTELKIAIENNIVEAYSLLGNIYNSMGDSDTADQLYLLGVEKGDIESAKQVVNIAIESIDNEEDIKEIHKLFKYLIEDKEFSDLLKDLGDFYYKLGNNVEAYGKYNDHYIATGNIESLKKCSEVLEKESQSFKFLNNIKDSRKEIYEKVILISNIRKDYKNIAYGLEKIADLLLEQGKNNAAINNYKSIYFLGKEKRNLKIIEQGAYKLLKYLDNDKDLIIEIQTILMINDKNHLLTIGNYYEEKNNKYAALENYFIANEYQIAGSSESIINLIYINYLNENKNSKIEEIINKLDDYKILDEQDKEFLRLYINFE